LSINSEGKEGSHSTPFPHRYLGSWSAPRSCRMHRESRESSQTSLHYLGFLLQLRLSTKHTERQISQRIQAITYESRRWVSTWWSWWGRVFRATQKSWLMFPAPQIPQRVAMFLLFLLRVLRTLLSAAQSSGGHALW